MENPMFTTVSLGCLGWRLKADANRTVNHHVEFRQFLHN